MRQTPYEHEYQSAPTLKDQERLEYFLTRTFETDEVWLLRDTRGLLQRTLDAQPTLPVWPYRRFASDAALDYWQDCVPTSVSLEYFLEHTLQMLAQPDLTIEIMPRGEAAGCLIPASQLTAIVQGMMDAGEYRLDS